MLDSLKTHTHNLLLVARATELLNETGGVQDRSRHEYGISAFFERIGQTGFGYKAFRSRQLRDKTWQLQRYGYDFGIAPFIFDGVFTYKGKHSNLYCYITEVVKTVVVRSLNVEVAISICREMVKLLPHIGIQPVDIHKKNVGLTNDGRAVVIDWGHMELPCNCDIIRGYRMSHLRG